MIRQRRRPHRRRNELFATRNILRIITSVIRRVKVLTRRTGILHCTPFAIERTVIVNIAALNLNTQIRYNLWKSELIVYLHPAPDWVLRPCKWNDPEGSLFFEELSWGRESSIRRCCTDCRTSSFLGYNTFRKDILARPRSIRRCRNIRRKCCCRLPKRSSSHKISNTVHN